MRTLPLHRAMAAALLPMLLLAVACAPGTTDPGQPDQMHGNAELPPASVSPTPTVPQEDPMLHTSQTEVTGTETAVVTTSKGVIVLEFFPDAAPNTVASFIELADAGFYDGIKFHRVVPRFVVQGGDPLTRDLTADEVRAGAPGVGTGDPGWKQKAEFSDLKHERGTLAMARGQYSVDSAGSQFYICLEPQPSLDGQYTIFGRVASGMEVVDAIAVGDVIESIVIER